MLLQPSQQLAVICSNEVLTNTELSIIQEDLFPFDHEEADSEIILHAHQVLKNAFAIVIWTVDTDVLVLAIAAAARCNNKHLWVSFDVGDSYKALDSLILKITVGYKKALALPVFHALIGCDTVSSFKSIEKKKTVCQR